MPNEAPYKIEKRGEKYVVLNNTGAVKATFGSRGKALAYLQALYANVPGAAKKAAKTPWTGKAKAFLAAAADRHELARQWAPTLTELPDQAAAAPVSTDDRKKMAKGGTAMPDGSFPIPDVEHLRSAIRLARTPAQRAHVIKRARALGRSDLIPESWKSSSSG